MPNGAVEEPKRRGSGGKRAAGGRGKRGEEGTRTETNNPLHSTAADATYLSPSSCISSLLPFCLLIASMPSKQQLK